jgi:transposase-like protein
MPVKQKCPRCGEYRSRLKYIGHQFPSCNSCFRKWYRKEAGYSRELIQTDPLEMLRLATRQRIAEGSKKMRDPELK